MIRTRLEAFSDAVIAIVITIMVLELKIPHGADLAALRPLIPVFLTYVLSFIYLGIYWNNHHHMLHTVERVNGRILWANLHLLFWLTLIPFATGWMGENHVAPLPTAVYGAVLLMAAIAYTILQGTIVSEHGPHSRLSEAVGSDVKGRISLAGYVAAIPLAFLSSWISVGLYILVALLWLVPDRRIESKMSAKLPLLALVLLLSPQMPLAGEKDRVIELQFVPQESTGGSAPSSLATLLDKPVRLEFQDGRSLSDMLQVGDGTGDDDELFAWRATTSVSEFAHKVFTQTAPGWGIELNPAGELTLNVRLVRFWVGERDQAVGSTYAAEARALGTLTDPAGKQLARFTGSGDARRYGRKRSAMNCNEVLSDALKQAYANLLTEQSAATAAPSAQAAAASPGEIVAPAALMAELVKLKDSGFSTELLVQYVNQRALTAPLSAADLLSWKESGLAEEVIRTAMARPVAGKPDAP